MTRKQRKTPLIEPTDRGLFCAAGGFYIDPWRPVDKAIITHAHADHCRPGHTHYLTAATGADLVRARSHPGSDVQGLPFGEPVILGDIRVSFHPAGHLLGSAQVRVERLSDDGRGGPRGETWCVTGDYKTPVLTDAGTPEPADGSCEPFEPVPCHTLITESTFGLPIYRWRPAAEVIDDINHWWRTNRADGLASVLFSYALGKSQRLLHAVDDTIGPIFVHGSVKRFVELYRAGGVRMPDVKMVQTASKAEVKDGPLVVAPQSVRGTTWLKRFGRASLASASGWMRVRGNRRRGGLDRGFVLSDHVDWPGLLAAIDATGCERVGVTHGQVHPVVRYLREERGLDAFVVPTRFEAEAAETEAADA